MSKLPKTLLAISVTIFLTPVFSNELSTNANVNPSNNLKPGEEMFMAEVPANNNGGMDNTLNNMVNTFRNSSHSDNSFTETSLSIDNPLSREPVGLIFDHTFSAITGAEAIITGFRGYQLIDDYLFQSTSGNTSGSMIASRVGKFAFESLLANFLSTTQHEIFGHGARAREFHVDVKKYELGIFTGKTILSSKDYMQLSSSEKIALTTGGIEGTDILARQIRNRWLWSQTIDSREANLYFFNYIDQTHYILGTKVYSRDKHISHGNDILTYVYLLNQWNPQHPITSSQLRKKVLVDFLNPYLFYSIYSMGLYVLDGCQSWEYPMIPIGEYKYLPMFRLALAPYGPEYQFINLIKGPEHNIIATFRYGNTAKQHSSAIGIEISDILTSEKLFIDGKLELWNQPRLFTKFASSRKKIGAAASLVARYSLLKQLNIFGQVGYKTTGYIPGEELKHGPILRMGFLLNI